MPRRLIRPSTLVVATVAAADAYLLGLLLVAAVARPPVPCRPGRRLRFLVLVPARDEEAVLGDTLASLAAADHPAALHEVVVVADNCRDGTATVAQRAGARVWERRGDAGGGKGEALAWALARVVDERPDVDAVVLVDADCTVDPGLLAAIEARMAAGADAVQVVYGAANPDGSWLSALRWASLALVNEVRPRGKAALGLSAGLFGTGMAFRRRLLADVPWMARSLIEDREHHLALVAAGRRVAFAPESVVRSVMPMSAAAARSQQQRWDAGRADLLREALPRLLRDGARLRDPVRLHAAIELLVPPQSLLLAGNAIALVVGLRAGGAARRIATAGVAAQAAYVLGGLALVRAPASVWRALAYAPALAVWKLGLLARSWVGRGPTTWERTERPSPTGSAF